MYINDDDNNKVICRTLYFAIKGRFKAQSLQKLKITQR